MANLRAALAALTQTEGEYRAAAPQGWTQGRTLYGGMIAAMGAEAAARATPQLPPLRSAQFSFIGPAAGELCFRPQLLRQGRSSAVVGLDCVSEGKLAARGLFTYGAARASAVRHADRLQSLPPPPEACELFTAPHRDDPGFFQNFEMRRAGGSALFAGPDAEPVLEFWIRHRDDSGVDPTIALLALADGLPPAAMAQFPKPAPISTMTWSVDIAEPPRLGEWFLSRSVAESSEDGYSFQGMELFDASGVRVAAGRQVVAIFV